MHEVEWIGEVEGANVGGTRWQGRAGAALTYLVHGERHADAIFLQQHGSGSRGPAGAREKKRGTRGWCTEVPLASAAETAAVGAKEATPRSLELGGPAGEACPVLVVVLLSAGC